MIPWSSGRWLNPPFAAETAEDGLLVTASPGSDFWQRTSYGFERDSGHALLRPFVEGSAVEVSFVVSYDQTFDQAGLLVRVDPTTWVKAGVEISDGVPQLGAVATRGLSDWSMAPVPEWGDRHVTVRASWADAALTLRARVDDEPWRMLRLTPFPPPGARAEAAPSCRAPEREVPPARSRAGRDGPPAAARHWRPPAGRSLITRPDRGPTTARAPPEARPRPA